MSKKILFVLHGIGLGGSMTSLLNLLELLKNEGYNNIDLLIMEHTGVFLDRARNAANLLPENKKLASIVVNPKKLLKRIDVLGLFYRLCFVVMKFFLGKRFDRKNIYKKQAAKYSGYDTVISFQEGTPTHFAQYIDAPNKIVWVHNEYKWIKGRQSDKEMQDVFDKFNHVVCVSSRAKESLLENLNLNPNNLHLIYNTFNSKFIIDSSKKFEYEVDKNKLNLVSVGRMAEQKRFDRIIPVAKRLISDNIDFVWTVVGSGDLFDKLNQAVIDNSLQKNVRFVGAYTNPYPIISACDVIILTSLYEAHPMVAIEGLTLNKPVITTDYPSAHEFINDRENGLICENSEDGIYNAIKNFATNDALRDNLNNNALSYEYDNKLIIKQVVELF